jgi:hypothetical protein
MLTKKILLRLTKFNPKVLKSSNQFGKFIRIRLYH